jgi:CRISPR/Cas system CSM-associated protein Csm4 (group 5 of RAMP superfamily)
MKVERDALGIISQKLFLIKPQNFVLKIQFHIFSFTLNRSAPTQISKEIKSTHWIANNNFHPLKDKTSDINKWTNEIKKNRQNGGLSNNFEK